MSAMLPYYSSISAALQSALPRLLPRDAKVAPPSIIVVRSPFALTEHLAIGRQDFIVYDQFLGQILARLSALSDQNAPLVSIDTYLVRLYASRLLVNGAERESLFVALVHQSLRAKDPFRGEPNPERLRSVFIQEMFTAAHELAHHYYRACPPVRDSWSSFVLGFLTTAECISDSERLDRTEELEATVVDELAQDYNREYARRYGELDADVAERGIGLLRESLKKRMTTAPSMRVGVISSNSVLTEEVVCDSIAVLLTAMATEPHTPADLQMTMRSCLAASQHLRLILLFDWKIRSNEDGKSAHVDSFRRGAYMRLFIRAVFESELIPKLMKLQLGDCDLYQTYKAVHEEIRRANVRFYEEFYDQVDTGFFFDRFVENDRSKIMAEALEDLPKGREAWLTAAAILGFGEFPKSVAS